VAAMAITAHAALDEILRINYVAEPTLADFHNDRSRFRCIMGPFGSGKTTACCVELLIRAMAQGPDHKGNRLTRFLVVRNTHKQLEDTTVDTWKRWIPAALCRVTDTIPRNGYLEFPLEDGTTVKSRILFRAMDKVKDVRQLLSMDLSGAFLNEARELRRQFFFNLGGRVDRYPNKDTEGIRVTFPFVISDTNPPDTEHWCYRLAEEEKPEGWRFFKQPGALQKIQIHSKTRYIPNPAAENVSHHNAGYRYWLDQIPGATEDHIRVHMLGQYGFTFDGRPVYDGLWNRGVHVAREPLPIYRGLPLWLGWDFGLTPACVMGQLLPTGRLHVLRESCLDYGGIKQLVEQKVRALLANQFNGMALHSWADPAGIQRSQVNVETGPIIELNRLGIPTRPAPTNDFQVRREAVAAFLTRMIDGGPGILVDPSCERLIAGFDGGFHFSRVQVVGSDQLRDKPDKTIQSHPHDGLQYMCEGINAQEIADRNQQRMPPVPVQQPTWEAYR